jgi:hypothetical protein
MGLSLSFVVYILHKIEMAEMLLAVLGKNMDHSWWRPFLVQAKFGWRLIQIFSGKN